MRNIISPQILIFIGVILSAIGAFWASHQQARSEKVLREKSDEISRLNTKIVNIVTGGDGFCYFFFSGTMHNPITLTRKGEFPLHDVKCRLVTLGDYTKLSSRSLSTAFSPSEQSLNIGELRPGAWGLQPKFSLSEAPIQGFNIYFEARNGTWEQLLRFQINSGDINWATKVVRKSDGNEIVLLEDQSAGFPINSNGKIDWYQP